MKKFFKKTEGFTLVELIVVIAILGILAGVGTVGYSGYIKKANEAADNQLLAAVNTAFTSAGIAHGIDVKDSAQVNAGNAKLTIDDKKLDYDQSVLVNDAVKSSFATYMGSDGEFKYFDKLFFVKGAFVGKNINALAGEMKNSVEDTGFNDETVMGNMLGYLGQIDEWLAGGTTLDDLIGQAPQSIVDALGFTDMSVGFENMGVMHFASDAAGRTAEEILTGASSLMTLLGPAYYEAAVNAEKNNPNVMIDYYKQTLEGDELAAFERDLANDRSAAILQAENALQLSFGDLQLDAYQVAAVMRGAGDTKNNADISGLGAMYALAAGFYHSSYGADLTQPGSFAEFDAVKSAMVDNNTAFTEYMGSDQALKDMEAYVGLMTYLTTGEFGTGEISTKGYDYIAEALGWK